MNTCTCHRQQNRTNTSPTKTRKIPPRTPDSDLNPHPKMPPIAVSKPTTDDNKPDLVQEAHGGDNHESVPEKMDEEDEGRAPSRLAGGGQPDEDFEFGDQADPELAGLQ